MYIVELVEVDDQLGTCLVLLRKSGSSWINAINIHSFITVQY